jgi:hypothetical protein
MQLIPRLQIAKGKIEEASYIATPSYLATQLASKLPSYVVT